MREVGRKVGGNAARHEFYLLVYIFGALFMIYVMSSSVAQASNALNWWKVFARGC